MIAVDLLLIAINWPLRLIQGCAPLRCVLQVSALSLFCYLSVDQGVDGSIWYPEVLAGALV
jgi:hypothetical protein